MTEAISNAAGLQGRIGQLVDARGRYDIWDLGPHRVLLELPDGSTQAVRQVVNLVLDDAAVLRLWVRPAAEMKRLHGQAVVVRGRLVAGDAAGGPAAAPTSAPSLLDIVRIEPA
jgi:hypothetical protein